MLKLRRKPDKNNLRWRENEIARLPPFHRHRRLGRAACGRINRPPRRRQSAVALMQAACGRTTGLKACESSGRLSTAGSGAKSCSGLPQSKWGVVWVRFLPARRLQQLCREIHNSVVITLPILLQRLLPANLPHRVFDFKGRSQTFSKSQHLPQSGVVIGPVKDAFLFAPGICGFGYL